MLFIPNSNLEKKKHKDAGLVFKKKKSLLDSLCFLSFVGRLQGPLEPSVWSQQQQAHSLSWDWLTLDPETGPSDSFGAAAAVQDICSGKSAAVLGWWWKESWIKTNVLQDCLWDLLNQAGGGTLIILLNTFLSSFGQKQLSFVTGRLWFEFCWGYHAGNVKLVAG